MATLTGFYYKKMYGCFAGTKKWPLQQGNHINRTTEGGVPLYYTGFVSVYL